LIQAAMVWTPQESERIFNRFPGAWRDRLRSGWAARLSRGEDAAKALESLRAEAASEARPDPASVHESWWNRALQEESDAVRAAIMTSAPGPIREALKAENAEIAPSGLSAHPEALQVALSLWAERLVGGPSARSLDEEPEVVRLVSGDAKNLARRLARLSLAKWGYVLACGGPPLKAEAKANLSDAQKARIERFQALWPNPDPRAGQLGRLDVDHHVTGKPQDLQSLGLVTVARLLASADPHRTRWALQHVPYNLAKFLRSRMGLKTPFIAGDELVSWEESLFRVSADSASSSADQADADPGGDEA
jgi:hypothetical protein